MKKFLVVLAFTLFSTTTFAGVYLSGNVYNSYNQKDIAEKKIKIIIQDKDGNEIANGISEKGRGFTIENIDPQKAAKIVFQKDKAYLKVVGGFQKNKKGTHWHFLDYKTYKLAPDGTWQQLSDVIELEE